MIGGSLKVLLTENVFTIRVVGLMSQILLMLFMLAVFGWVISILLKHNRELPSSSVLEGNRSQSDSAAST